MVLNSLTLLPAREIYPTPEQLPPYVISSPYDPDRRLATNRGLCLCAVKWGPIRREREMPTMRTVVRFGPSASPNYSHNQGFLLANYLAGTNAAGQPITWPVFPGSSTQGFAGKYTKRQLDSIVAQILSIGSKAISSDFPYTSGEVGEQIGTSLYGRALRVPRLAKPPMGDRPWTLHESYPTCTWKSRRFLRWELGTRQNPKNTPRQRQLSISGSSGGCRPAISADQRCLIYENSRIVVGHRYSPGLNAIDMPRFLKEPSRPNPFAAPLPRMPDADSSAIYCFWANQLLRNNQGIDFAGNPGGDAGTPVLDHDQQLAKTYHDPFARISPASAGPWKYKGSTPSTNGLLMDTQVPSF